MMRRKLFLCCILGVFVGAAAHATFIDLNDFFFFPGDPVTISPDGSSATIGELTGVSPVVLSNDPGDGDPEVIFAGPGLSLNFDYNFVEGSASDDEFGVFIIDAATGFSAGPAFEFFTQDTSSGSVSFDLSPLTGKMLGLQFQLSSDISFDGIDDLNSLVTISNVHVIPEPSTVLLFVAGVIAIVISGLRARRKALS